MREVPFLFSGPMVLRLLDDSKTMTRRILSARNSLVDGRSGKAAVPLPELDVAKAFIDPGPSPAGNRGPYLKAPRSGHDTTHRIYPRVQLGDRIWVKETFYCDDYRYPSGPVDELRDALEYRADHECSSWEAGCPCGDENGRGSWRPSIHMPRWASRITLEVTGVRPERLKEISEADARAEGIGLEDTGNLLDGGPRDRFRFAFSQLWDRINGAGSWAENPWVWCVEFRRIESAKEAA